jgi:hypothetical protein
MRMNRAINAVLDRQVRVPGRTDRHDVPDGAAGRTFDLVAFESRAWPCHVTVDRPVDTLPPRVVMSPTQM